MTKTPSAQTMLADQLEALRSKRREDWYVHKEPHNYADGTTHFNHVRYKAKDCIVEVAQYATPDLAELLCALHNNIDTIVAALRADARDDHDGR